MSLVTEVEKILERKLDDLASTIFQELINEVPVRTGATKQSFRVRKTAKFERKVGSTRLSAKYADEGNGPGRIYPRDAKRLRFRGNDGRIHYAKSVNPYKGDHFVREVANRHR